MQCRIAHFKKMAVDVTNGTGVFHWSSIRNYLFIAKVYCAKERQTEVYVLRTT